ncbi:MAG: methyltransferase [Nocardioidaceae bacterium]
MDPLAPDAVDLLRTALDHGGYRYDAVAALLGPVAHAALSRNETVPGLQATAGGSPLETLVRLWVLQSPVVDRAAEAALPGLVETLVGAGLLQRSAGETRAVVDVRPYADDHDGTSTDWWVVSDLTPGLDGRPVQVSADHVLGVSSASTSLAQLTVRDPVERAFDLGTGCGVQALHLAAHAAAVVASDVNPRALAMTRLNAALNGVDLDVRAGSLYEPVTEERFDLVVTNPPFVVSPATGERLVYRDSGLPGDEVVRRVVTAAPAHLVPGGWCQVLGNWVHQRGRSWQERVGGWLDGLGCDAWVVQREAADPAAYVELWLKDAGVHGRPDYVERYDAWLRWFEEQGIEAVGFGWLHLRRVDREPVVHLEEWPWELEQPLGHEVLDRGRRTDALAALSDVDLLGLRPVVRVDVRQETVGEPGAADPESIVVRQQRGMRRARRVDTTEAGLVGACDGDLTVGQILAALATLVGEDEAARRPARLAAVREMLADGFLTLG